MLKQEVGRSVYDNLLNINHMGLAFMSSQQLQLLTKASLDQNKTEHANSQSCVGRGTCCCTHSQQGLPT